MRNTHIVLHRALADAERLRLVMRNVGHLARPPAVPHVERATWTADELRSFLRHVAGDRLFIAYLLLATTGMRRGEVFGLRWRDADLAARRASVTQTITTVNDKLIIGPTKTNRSRRTISLDPTAIEALEAHRVAQDAERSIAGDAWDSSFDLVICDGTGRPEHPDRFSRQFQRHVGETNLPPLRGRTICATLGRHSRSMRECIRRSCPIGWATRPSPSPSTRGPPPRRSRRRHRRGEHLRDMT